MQNGALSPMPDYEPKIIAMVCTYCTYTAADMAGSMRLQYPAQCADRQISLHRQDRYPPHPENL